MYDFNPRLERLYFSLQSRSQFSLNTLSNCSNNMKNLLAITITWHQLTVHIYLFLLSVWIIALQMCSCHGQNNKILLQQLSKWTAQTAYKSSKLFICKYIYMCVCAHLIGHLSSATCRCFRLSSCVVVILHNRSDREIPRCPSQWHTCTRHTILRLLFLPFAWTHRHKIVWHIVDNLLVPLRFDSPLPFHLFMHLSILATLVAPLGSPSATLIDLCTI